VDPENKEMAKEQTVAEAGKKKKDDEVGSKTLRPCNPKPP